MEDQEKNMSCATSAPRSLFSPRTDVNGGCSARQGRSRRRTLFRGTKRILFQWNLPPIMVGQMRFVGEVHVRLRSGRKITLKDVHYVPASRVSLLSLSSLLKHGWTVDMRDGGGTIKRGKERLALRKDGPLWTTVVGTVEPLILSAGISNLGRSALEEEHQRLGHIGREKLLDLAKAGKLEGSYEDLRKDPFRTNRCEVCLRAKIERHPKTGEAPLLQGGKEGIGHDVDLAGPLDLSVDGHRYLFVGIERSSGIVSAVPIETKAAAMKAVRGAVSKLERQLGERLRVIPSDGGKEFGGGEAIEWFKITGIQHYTSPRYTPELNGAAETHSTLWTDQTSPLGWVASLRASTEPENGLMGRRPTSF
jgi:hypothetical protein